MTESATAPGTPVIPPPLYLYGPPGPEGDPSTVPGPPGPGVATGGTLNQVLTKQSATNYDTAWSGTVQAVIRDRGGQVYDVKAYGAVGNGVADDTAAILATIATLNPAVGGVVFFPEGTYRISATLLVNQIRHCVLRGATNRASVIAPTTALAGLPVIRFQDCHHPEVDTLNVSGVPSGTVARCGVQQYHTTASGPNGFPTAMRLQDCFIGSDAAIGLQYGVEWLASATAADGNQEMGELFNVQIQGCTTAAYHIGHNNALQQRIYGGNISLCPTVVLLHGGSFIMDGTAIGGNSPTAYAFDFQAPFTGTGYLHKSMISNVTYEGSNLLLRSVSSLTQLDVDVISLDWAGAVASSTTIDWQAAGSRVSFISSFLPVGAVGQLAQFTSSSCYVRFVSCMLGFDTISFNGPLTMVGNQHSSFNPTFTNLGSGGLRKIGELDAGSGVAGLDTLGLLYVAPGSPTLPGLGFSSDTNTGFYNNAADQIAVTNGGTARWAFRTTDFVAATDNTYDIGNAGALRPRSIYAATSFVGPGAVPTGGASGQVLSKSSASDYALAWTTPSAGGLTLPLGQTLTFSPDSTYDIGASGASRPNNLFIAGAATINGNITIQGTSARRIYSPTMSQAGLNNRFYFQGDTDTWFTLRPGGTTGNSGFSLHNASDATNASYGLFFIDNTNMHLESGAVGTGTQLPMWFYVNGSPRLKLDTAGQVLVTGAGTQAAPALAVGEAVTGLWLSASSPSSTLAFVINSTWRWAMVSNVMLPNPDNSVDIGSTANRVKTVYTGALYANALPAFATGDHYLVVDSSGNVHKSALGPAS